MSWKLKWSLKAWNKLFSIDNWFLEAKEKHEYERQRAQQNLEKSKQEFEHEQALLEESINKKTARAELIKRERERVSFHYYVIIVT